MNVGADHADVVVYAEDCVKTQRCSDLLLIDIVVVVVVLAAVVVDVQHREEVLDPQNHLPPQLLGPQLLRFPYSTHPLLPRNEVRGWSEQQAEKQWKGTKTNAAADG